VVPRSTVVPSPGDLCARRTCQGHQHAAGQDGTNARDHAPLAGAGTEYLHETRHDWAHPRIKTARMRKSDTVGTVPSARHHRAGRYGPEDGVTVPSAAPRPPAGA